jgi:hypothetical protein
LFRGNKDEVFVRQALEQADYACGRWIASQRHFDVDPTSLLEPLAKAAVVTAVAIYVETARLSQLEVQRALAIETVAQARALIDRLHPLAFGGGWYGGRALR